MGLNRIRDMGLDYLEKGYSTKKPWARLEVLKSGYDFRVELGVILGMRRSDAVQQEGLGDSLRLDVQGRIRLSVDNFTSVSVDDRAAVRGAIKTELPVPAQLRHGDPVPGPGLAAAGDQCRPMTEPLVLAGYGIAMPVGAISVPIVTLPAGTSPAIGLAGVMDVATADGLSGATLVGVLQPVAGPMRWVAVTVPITLAAKGIVDAIRRYRAPSSVPTTDARDPMRTYLGPLGLTILNPLTIVYLAALVLGQANDSWSATGSTVFVLGAVVASASWQAFLAIGGPVIGRTLTGVKEDGLPLSRGTG